MAIVFLAAVTQGAIGFGFGLVSVAALSLFVELKTSTPFLAIVNLPVILYLFWRLRRAVVWSSVTPIIIAMLVAIPFGLFVLVNWPQEVLLRILGVVLVAAAIRSARSNSTNAVGEGPERSTPLTYLTDAVVGLTTGALSGAFNTGGPPVIAYVYCRPWSKERRTAALQAVFGISVITRIILMAAPPASLYSAPLLLADLACLPGVFLGMVAGYALFRRFPPRALEIFVAIFLFAVGVKLMIWA